MSKQYTLQQLATLTQSTLIGDPSFLITGIDSLESASSQDASFLSNPRYKEAMIRSKAGVILIHPSTERPDEKNYLLHENPSAAFQILTKLFCLETSSGFTGIHPTAVIHPSAHLGKGVEIGPYVTIDQGASIGDHSKIFSHASIGPHSQIGTYCTIYSHVTIREQCILGHRVVLQPGAVIGSCGFGFLTDAQGVHTKLDQLGFVEIEDDVEIGANTTIDRARFKTTRIGKGSKIDNLVQVGHNVQIGTHNLIVSQTGISGSAKTGSHVVLGGQTGVVGHLEIPSGTMIASRGGVSKTLAKPGKYAGAPVLPLAEHNKQQVYLRRIEEYVHRIEALERQLALLQEKLPLKDS